MPGPKLKPGDSIVEIKDRNKSRIWLTVRKDIVVGAVGSEPAKYVGLPLELARRIAKKGK